MTSAAVIVVTAVASECSSRRRRGLKGVARGKAAGIAGRKWTGMGSLPSTEIVKALYTTERTQRRTFHLAALGFCRIGKDGTPRLSQPAVVRRQHLGSAARRPFSDGIGRLHPRCARAGTLGVPHHAIDIRLTDSDFVLYSAVRALDLELRRPGPILCGNGFSEKARRRTLGACHRAPAASRGFPFPRAARAL
jgi:hypothetical protein